MEQHFYLFTLKKNKILVTSKIRHVWIKKYFTILKIKIQKNMELKELLINYCLEMT